MLEQLRAILEEDEEKKDKEEKKEKEDNSRVFVMARQVEEKEEMIKKTIISFTFSICCFLQFRSSLKVGFDDP